MKTLMQYLVLAVALMLLAYGVNRMQAARPTELPEPVTEQTRPEPTEPVTETTQPARPTEEPTLPAVTLADVVQLQLAQETVFACDTATGELVFCTGDPGQRIYPASITKLFTAWVALRFLPPEEPVTAGWELGFLQPGSSMAFIALDSRLTVQMLIEGMLLPSGNDAALVLAAAVGRQVLHRKNATASEAVAAFVEEMNRAAEALQLVNSHFENPDGYHSADHYSCPADLAVIACYALEEPVIRRCMGLQSDTVTFLSGQTHRWENTNRLLDPDSECYSPDAVGMKTGYTGTAGYCLLAAFGGEYPLVVGVFGGGDPVSRYHQAAQVYAGWKTLAE